MTLDDAEHYTPAQKAAIIASYPEHERDARTKGIPTLGSGRIFPVTEESITCDPIEIPAHWPQIGAMDFGIDHPFAAVALAWDRDADCVYVTKTHRVRGQTPILQAAALKPWGDWLPWRGRMTAWPETRAAPARWPSNTAIRASTCWASRRPTRTSAATASRPG